MDQTPTPDLPLEEPYEFQEWEKSLLRFDGNGNVWSWSREEFVSPRVYASEKRHRARYRSIMGTADEVNALNEYEQQMGLQ